MPHTPCLSDGSIIMSKGGLDTCYREPAHADCRASRGIVESNRVG
jgi:hypothetical protein